MLESPHTQVLGTHEEPIPHPCGIFCVSWAAAIGTSGSSRAPHGFVQEPICKAQWERVCCLPGFCVVPLGPCWASAGLRASLHGNLGAMTQMGGMEGERGGGFNHRPGLRIAPVHKFRAPCLQFIIKIKIFYMPISVTTKNDNGCELLC